MVRTPQIRVALLVLLLLLLFHLCAANNEGIFVESISTAFLVVGLVTLVFAIAAALVGAFVFKIIVQRCKNDKELSSDNEAVQQLPDLETPASHTYDFVDNQPAMAPGVPHPYEVVVSERQGIPNSVSPLPDEVGFTVTATTEDDHSGYEEYDPDPTEEKHLVTPNPFYSQRRERLPSPPEYENHELVEYEEKTKRDLSQPMEIPAYSVHGTESGHQDLQLESAINFYGRDEIEGDLIDEVDYQNVTVVRTKVANPQVDEVAQHSDLFQRGIATSAIQWDGQEGNTETNDTFNKPCQQESSEDVDECYDDVSKLVSEKGLYQNFGPSQSAMVRVVSSGSLELEESNAANAHDASFDRNYEADTPGETGLYMNSASLKKEQKQDEDDMDYENMIPGR